MRLLHCHRGPEGNIAVGLEEHNEPDVPPYAILSHRWGSAGEEVTFRDFMNGTAEAKKDYAKVEGCCAQALKEDLSYVWTDTCCIDRSSSAELSEAINSMYRYYRSSGVCFAYLQDVSTAESDPEAANSEFRGSEWFKRGWTLQELIAPKNVIFFSKDWAEFGSRKSLAVTLEQITNIDRYILWDPVKMDGANISTRMSWAAKRNTTRIEDRAYSLMGIFSVNMPIIYGEGEGAFTRLQLEIIKTSTDHSIFAWDDPLRSSRHALTCGILARDPRLFLNGSSIETVNLGTISRENIDNKEHYELTNLGLRIWLPVQSGLNIGDHEVLRASLACRIRNPDPNASDEPFTIYLEPVTTASNSKQYRRIITEELRNTRSAWSERPRSAKIQELFIDATFSSQRWSLVPSLRRRRVSHRNVQPQWIIQVDHSIFEGFVVVDTDLGRGMPPVPNSKPFVLEYLATAPSFWIRFRNKSTEEVLVAFLYFGGTSPSCDLQQSIGAGMQSPEELLSSQLPRLSELESGDGADWTRAYLPLTKRNAILSVRYPMGSETKRNLKARIYLQDSRESYR